MNYSKILIIGESLHNKSGGGITLNNLFFDYPKDRILIAANHKTCKKAIKYDGLKLFQLGFDNYKMPFPFYFFQNKYSSGVWVENNERNNSSDKISGNFIGLLLNIYQKIFHWSGLSYYFDRLKLTNEFIDWVRLNKPDYIYSQLSTLSLIRFVRELSKITSIPIVVHIMDNWLETIAEKNILSWYWRYIIDTEFRELLMHTKFFLSISDKMTENYKIKYGIDCYSFHNPVELNYWFKEQPNTKKQVNDVTKFAYFGRIGRANQNTILFLINLINKSIKPDVEFHIYSDDTKFDRLSTNKVTIHRAIPYENVREFMIKYDLLVLPLDFTKDSINFAKFSIPTKFVEYLATGIPTLVIAPIGLALTDFISNHNCAYLCTSLDKRSIESILFNYYNDYETKNIILNNAKRVIKKFDAKLVRQNFYSIFN